MVVSGALFDMRDLAQMLAHVHDAAMEVGEGPTQLGHRARSEKCQKPTSRINVAR
jgi:hypothetical protein